MQILWDVKNALINGVDKKCFSTEKITRLKAILHGGR